MARTIYALSSGLPPAGIAVVRISGPDAGAALQSLAGSLPPPRRARLASLRGRDGDLFDTALVLWFPGPGSATGEDLAELHLHGGRAVVAAVLAELATHAGLAEARAGEFTRRAFENGRIDLAEAEGLADLIRAETESQRRAALALAEGGLGERVGAWRARLLEASARIEAQLDFSDEGDIAALADSDLGEALAGLAREIEALRASPPAERLKDGVRVVLAGPPNAGKSSLFNMLAGRQAAIVTEIPGTTRDLLEAPVAIDGVPLLLIDTAGLRADGGDPVEAIGIERAGAALTGADIVLWLGEAEAAPEGALLVAAKADLRAGSDPAPPGLAVSVVSGEGLDSLRSAILERARGLLPAPGALALNARHRALLEIAGRETMAAAGATDPLIAAEHLRAARVAFDAITGKAGVEDMLDALFAAMCVGK